jgi:hypothetical protein
MVSMMEQENQTSATDSERSNVEMFKDYVREAESGLTIGITGTESLEDLRKLCGRYYLGDQFENIPRVGLKQFTINRTQNSIISTTQIQLEQPPRRRLSPVETSDPPQYVLSERGVRKLQMAVAAGMVQVGNLDPMTIEANVVLDDALGSQLEMLLKPVPDPMTGMQGEPVLTDRDLFVVNDALKAEVMQTILDKMWDAAYGDRYAREAQLMASIFGDQAIAYEWDNIQHRSRYVIPNYVNVLYDPKATWVDDAEYVILDQFMSLPRAKEEYPDFEAELESAAETGKLRDHNSRFSTEQRYDRNPYGHVDFQTKQVTISTLWRRHVMYRPMTEDEAIRSKKVIKAVDPVAMGPEMVSYTLAVNGATTHPTAASWPCVRAKKGTEGAKSGIQQLTIIREIEREIEDIKCPYKDIPIPWCKNIPIPYSPYGLGEPLRLKDVQDLINLSATIILNHMRYYQYPQEYWPATLYQALKKAGQAIHNHPGRQIPIDDESWKEFFAGNSRPLGFSEQPPPLPNAAMEMLDRALQEHDRLSGNVDALQGEAPYSGASGKLVEALGSQAKGPMGFKAAPLEDAIRWLTELELDAIVNWMPDEEWDRYLSRYPHPVRTLIRDGAKSLQYDVTAETVAGKVANREVRRQQANDLYQAGAIGTEDLLESADWPDPKRAIARKQQEMQSGQAAQAPMAAPQPAGNAA